MGLLIFVLALCFFSALSIGFYTLKNGIGPTPTLKKVRNTLCENLPNINDGSVAILGSGFGILLCSVAKKYSHLKIIGYENSFIVYLVSKCFVWRYSNIELKKDDFFKHNIGGNKLLVCYLYPGAMEKLKQKLSLELDENIHIVTHTFAFRGIKESKIIYANDIYKTPIYFYEFKRNAVL